jgi:ABC-2 type transport system permease protein
VIFRDLRQNGRVVAMAFELTLRQIAVDSFVLFGVFFQPLIIALLAIWMLQPSGTDGAIFVVVGSGMTGLWSTLLFVGGNSITMERWSGTLESLVGQPTPISVIIFGKNLATVLLSLVAMVASYGLSSVVFGTPLHVAQPLIFLLSLGFTVMSFVCFGLIIAPIFILNPGVQQWQNALEFPVYILAGFLFPIALLPGWTTPISYLLAPYWAARVLHAASTGTATAGEAALCWGMMTLFSAVYLVVSSRLMNSMLYKARVDATLGME